MATGYNADSKSVQRSKRDITIGGQVFRPVKKTGEVIRHILEMDVSFPEEEMSPEEQKAYSIKVMEQQYDQLANLIVDPESGEHPERDYLEKELDMEDLTELMQMLMPTGDRGN